MKPQHKRTFPAIAFAVFMGIMGGSTDDLTGFPAGILILVGMVVTALGIIAIRPSGKIWWYLALFAFAGGTTLTLLSH